MICSTKNGFTGTGLRRFFWQYLVSRGISDIERWHINEYDEKISIVADSKEMKELNGGVNSTIYWQLDFISIFNSFDAISWLQLGEVSSEELALASKVQNRFLGDPSFEYPVGKLSLKRGFLIY